MIAQDRSEPSGEFIVRLSLKLREMLQSLDDGLLHDVRRRQLAGEVGREFLFGNREQVRTKSLQQLCDGLRLAGPRDVKRLREPETRWHVGATARSGHITHDAQTRSKRTKKIGAGARIPRWGREIEPERLSGSAGERVWRGVAVVDALFLTSDRKVSGTVVKLRVRRAFCGVVLVLSACARLQAGVLPTHAFVGVDGLSGLGSLPPFNGPGFHYSVLGETLADSGYFSDWADGEGTVPPYFGEAHAISRSDSDRLLRAYAGADGTGNGGFDPWGFATSVATWRDIAYVTSGPAPAAIRLNFGLHGILFASIKGLPNGNPDVRYGWSEFGVSWTTEPTRYFEPSQGGADFGAGNHNHALEATVNYQWLEYGDGPIARGFFGHTWDTAKFEPPSQVPNQFPFFDFTGTFHVDVPYSPELGGYGWGIKLTSWAQAKSGEALGNAFGTMQLSSATLLDGTPVDLRFDSGLSFAPQAVPEPSSLALLGTGLVGLIGYRRRPSRHGRAA